MQEQNEHRKYYRWIKRLTLKFRDLEGQDVTKRAVTENISEGGLQIILPYRLKLGQLVRATIEITHDSIPISADCKVVHLDEEKNSFRTGLEFSGLDDFQKQRLIRYLNEGAS